jgi:hypothetical protein
MKYRRREAVDMPSDKIVSSIGFLIENEDILISSCLQSSFLPIIKLPLVIFPAIKLLDINLASSIIIQSLSCMRGTKFGAHHSQLFTEFFVLRNLNHKRTKFLT